MKHGRWMGALLLALGAWCGGAQALTAEQALAISVGETDARIEALGRALAQPDERTAVFLQALGEEQVKRVGDRVRLRLAQGVGWHVPPHHRGQEAPGRSPAGQ